MTLLERANELALQLIEVDNILNGFQLDLLEENELDELEKLKKLYNFYAYSVLELVMDENKEFVVKNSALTEDIIIEIEYFINSIIPKK